MTACQDSAPTAIDTTLPDEARPAAAPKIAKAPEPMRVEAAAQAASACFGSECRVLTPSGWAGIRPGMPVETAMQASGFDLKKPGRYDEFNEDDPDALEACNIYQLVGAPSNLFVFVENGIVTSIGVGESDDARGARFKTDKGVSIGDPEKTVRSAYAKLEQEPDIYSEPPDKKLFYRSAGGNGIKFSIVGGKVVEIDVGGGSINYVEGCL